MINQKRVLAIIPARGGSKGLPRKNIRLLNDLPLIAWPIKAAQSSKYIDRVVVTTDDDEIAAIALEYGAEVPFLRPKEFATDTSPSSEAIVHAINFCTKNYEEYSYIVLLEPTSPLTEAFDVDKALEILINSSGLAIVGTSKVEATHPIYCATIGSNGFLKPFNRASFSMPIRRQDVDDLYFFEGSLYISDTTKYLESHTFYHEFTLPYLVPAWKALEIDTLLDFIKIEAVMKNKELLSITNEME
jgi:CMP-N,N'-diacetyllegionaminic acid synthase